MNPPLSPGRQTSPREGAAAWADDDSAILTFATGPALSVADATAAEGDDSTADFVVTLDPAATGTVTVDYATTDGTATAPADYGSTSGTLTFAAGETLKTVSVPIVDDTVAGGTHGGVRAMEKRYADKRRSGPARVTGREGGVGSC